MVSSRCFIVSCFTFRSVIHFELIFVKDVKSVSPLIYFARGCPVVPASFVEKTSFVHQIAFDFFVKDQLTIFVWVCFWALYSVPLIYLFIILPIWQGVDYCRFFFVFCCFFKKLFIYLFIYYLFLAVLGLRFCAWAFSSCGKWGPLFIAVRVPLTVAASHCRAQYPDAQAQ